MTKKEIIDNIARLNSQTWRDREEVRTEIGKLLSELKKSLEQEPCEDIMTIHTQGLDEGIRCAMCTNSMKSDRGCDGGCVVNEAMYKEVMNTIRNHIVPLVTPTHIDLDGLKSDMKALNCGYPYGLDYLLDCLKKTIRNNHCWSRNGE